MGEGGVKNPEKITDVVYAWSQNFPSLALALFLVTTLVSKLAFVMLLKRNLCTRLYIAIVSLRMAEVLKIWGGE